jgi:hypothetical protein
MNKIVRRGAMLGEFRNPNYNRCSHAKYLSVGYGKTYWIQL